MTDVPVIDSRAEPALGRTRVDLPVVVRLLEMEPAIEFEDARSVFGIA